MEQNNSNIQGQAITVITVLLCLNVEISLVDGYRSALSKLDNVDVFIVIPSVSSLRDEHKSNFWSYIFHTHTLKMCVCWVRRSFQRKGEWSVSSLLVLFSIKGICFLWYSWREAWARRRTWARRRGPNCIWKWYNFCSTFRHKPYGSV